MLRQIARVTGLSLGLLMVIAAASGCERKTPAEKAGDKIENAGDKVEDKLDETN